MELQIREKRMQECQGYFKERAVFEKVFRGFFKKYASLGRMGGTVVLKNLSEEEKEQLGGFLGKDYAGKKQITVSYQALEDALGGSRFSDFTPQEILETYFHMPLIAKKEEKEREEKEKERYFARILSLAENPWEKEWLSRCINEKNKEFRFMEKEFRREPEAFFSVMQTVCDAGAVLPYLTGDYELLPVFATRMTKNPHAFDAGTAAHHFLLSYLQYLFPEASAREVSHTERVWGLFYQGGILKDDLSNAVLLYGLHGISAAGSVHDGMEGFFRQKEPVYLTLLSLTGIAEIYSGNETIYMVENPAVFSYLSKKYPEGSFICGNGQQRMAVWVLLSKIREEHPVFYAGDFDPEGLGIAQRLKQRFPEKVHLWKYDLGLYQKYVSAHGISKQRMQKLEHVVLPELQELCVCMRQTGCAAYQEAMLEEYEI